MKLDLFKAFPGGIHPSDRKEQACDCKIEVLPPPEDVFISLAQHIGAPAAPVVEPGSIVKRGQLIAKAAGAVSANIYSSLNGEVVEITGKVTATGGYAKHIRIKRTGDESVLLPAMKEKTPDAIRERITEAGIVGMGGAGFPTAVKLNPPKPVDTLLINGAECEPYLTCDARLMQEKPKEVFEGARLMASACGAKNIIFCIEANKPECVSALSNCGANVHILKTKYPHGSEKQMIYSALKRRVPAGKLPSDVGAVVQNCATAYAVYQAVEENMPLIERVMTVSGKSIKNPKNLLVPNGTQLQYIADYCGGINDDAVKLVVGGPMMGYTVDNLGAAVTKGTNGLLALNKEEAATADPTPCINCGKCARACPMFLMPMYIDMYALVNEFALAEKYGALHCIECGCCAYVCPARRAIVQSVRLAKTKLREKKK